MLDSVINVFSLSLAFTLIGLNLYLSTQVLNVTDLTCDASVTLGGCSYGALVLCGIDPLIAILIAACLGMVAGFVTSSLVAHISIEPVLASIVTLTAMQTFISKLSSVGHTLVDKEPVKTALLTPAIDNSIITLIVASAMCILFYKILNSEYGLAMRVYGDGKIISESMGINTGQILCMGLGVGNALSAIAGALVVQISGSFSPGIGNGSLVFGLAAVIIGEKILAPKSVKAAIIGCFVGSLVYKVAIEVATFGGSETVGSEYNNIIMAIVLIFLMALIHDTRGRGGRK